VARGWESKGVEAQMESAPSVRQPLQSVEMTPDERERLRKRNGLLLSRTRVLHDLETAHNPRYLDQLRTALLFLDSQLDQLH
jgi:hypothetical protein